MRRWQRLVLLIVVAAFSTQNLSGCALLRLVGIGRKEKGTQDGGPLKADWLLLDEPMPESSLDLGTEYDLRGQIRTGCYTYEESPVVGGGAGLEARSWSWDRTKGDTAAFRLWKALDLGGAAAVASKGSVTLDSVVVRFGKNVVPRACPGVTRDGLPMLPAISALLGARAVHIKTDRTSALALSAKLKEQGMSHVQTSNDTTSFSFTGLRWLGVHLMGFDVKGTGAWQGNARLAEITPVPHELQIRVTAAQGDSFNVAWKRTLPGAEWTSISAARHESVIFGVPDGKDVSGSFGLLSVSPTSTDSVSVDIAWLRYAPVQWVNESQREDVATWLAGRALLAK